jgi:C1A family cysteine protease
MEAIALADRPLNFKPNPQHKNLPLHKPGLLLSLSMGLTLPASTDLEPVSPPVYDQLRWGSCTMNSAMGVIEIEEKREGHDFGPGSRMAGYFWEEAAQGNPTGDVGGTDTLSMQVLMRWGIPPESAWAYVAENFGKNPPHLVYALARQRLLSRKAAVRVAQDHDHIVAMLAAGHAVQGGFSVPQSFMSQATADSGLWAGPQATDPIVGGHSVAIVGHNDVSKTYKIRNSWGTGWGKNGYVWMPQIFWHSPQASDLIAVAAAA